jgi:hypothetical protein
MDYVESFNVGNLVVRIAYDPEPESPREWSNLGTMVCWHRGYNLGDGKPECSPSEFNPDAHAVCLPLYLYDHSGITMRTSPFSCPWDSGQVGWIYCDRATILKEYGKRHLSKALIARVTEALEAEVNAYDELLTGQVYGFVVEDSEGNHLDSCWGFYGLDYCKSEGIASAEDWLRENKKIDKMLQEVTK